MRRQCRVVSISVCACLCSCAALYRRPPPPRRLFFKKKAGMVCLRKSTCKASLLLVTLRQPFPFFPSSPYTPSIFYEHISTWYNNSSCNLVCISATPYQCAKSHVTIVSNPAPSVLPFLPCGGGWLFLMISTLYHCTRRGLGSCVVTEMSYLAL